MIDIYQIQENDSLRDIANRFNTTVDDILKVNNIAFPEEILVGMRLVIPQNKEQYFNTYTVSKGDSLYKIARQYNINPELLAAFNGLNFDDYIGVGHVIIGYSLMESYPEKEIKEGRVFQK